MLYASLLSTLFLNKREWPSSFGNPRQEVFALGSDTRALLFYGPYAIHRGVGVSRLDRYNCHGYYESSILCRRKETESKAFFDTNYLKLCRRGTACLREDIYILVVSPLFFLPKYRRRGIQVVNVAKEKKTPS